MNFFEALLDLKLENVKLEQGIKNPDSCCQKFVATDDVLRFFRFLNSEEQKICFWTANSQISLPLFRGYSWHKNQNKKIQGSCYRGKITQTERKPKRNSR